MRNGEAKAMSSTMRWTLGSILALGLAAGYGCGGDDGGDDDDATTEMTSPAGGGGTPSVKNDIGMTPEVSYSGFDGEHTFKVPLKVRVKPATDWKCEPAEACQIEPTDDGAMVTIRKSGDIKVTAKSGDKNGVAKISVTQYTPDEWATGQARYNNMVAALRGPDGAVIDPSMAAPGAGGGQVMVGGIMVDKNAACSNCHGDTARPLRIRHTPTQIAKFSDDQLVDIFTMAKKPEGATVRIVPADVYKLFHTWELKESERRGLVAFLRSLEPKDMEPLMIPGLGGGGTGAGLDAGVP